MNGRSDGFDPAKRATLRLLASGPIALASGCCTLRGFPDPRIETLDRTALAGPSAYLAPSRINAFFGRQLTCIDVHAHFFNASDVTVKGYLEGPVANSVGGVAGDLIRLLAPFADALAEIAPTAAAEYAELRQLDGLAASLQAAALEAELERRVVREQERVSLEFDALTRRSRAGRRFRRAYEDAARSSPPGAFGMRSTTLDENSVLEAMRAGAVPRSAAELRAAASAGGGPYVPGVLAFVGFMLSSRWSNLRTYQRAFTSSEHSVGVRRSLSALVDFDRWLDCAPRSAHRDQMLLQSLLSERSGEYMLPLISYNPWTDVVEPGSGLALVEEAFDRGFVGAKIYPPNGFRPYGNAGRTMRRGEPDGRKLDDALAKFWQLCADRGKVVMAHAGPTMGRDAQYDLLSGPKEWARLLGADFWKPGASPRINLGHVGGVHDGDGEGAGWPQSFAKLMGQPRADHVYGDLGYWDSLDCANGGESRCGPTKLRLAALLETPLPNGGTVADRVMFGTDWLMLSQVRDWASYPTALRVAVDAIAPDAVSRIFGENAARCFGGKVAAA